MHPKTQSRPQDELFRSRLEQIIDLKHPLCQLADKVKWSYFKQEFGPLYIEKRGRPGKPIRLMVALHYLKHTFDESDESVVERSRQGGTLIGSILLVLNISNIGFPWIPPAW